MQSSSSAQIEANPTIVEELGHDGEEIKEVQALLNRVIEMYRVGQATQNQNANLNSAINTLVTTLATIARGQSPAPRPTRNVGKNTPLSVSA